MRILQANRLLLLKAEPVPKHQWVLEQALHTLEFHRQVEYVKEVEEGKLKRFFFLAYLTFSTLWFIVLQSSSIPVIAHIYVFSPGNLPSFVLGHHGRVQIRR
jgi:hypothetical protein